MLPKNPSKGLILIAEDEQMIRQILRRTMEKEGYSVVEATNGKECLTVFENTQPDIIIMDGMMPEMDGATACAEIQKMPGGEDTPILMVTALNDDEMVHRAFEAGASDFLTKPVHWAVLQHRVDRLIKARRADQELQQLLADMEILRRIDRELGYTLEIQRVLDLAMDAAVRRAAAVACVIGWIREGTNSLQRLAAIGRPSTLIEPVAIKDLPEIYPSIYKVFEERKKTIYETHINENSVQLIIPLTLEGQVQGFIGLEQVPSNYLNKEDYDFLTYLASRTADAIEKVQVYEKSQLRAEQMRRLHRISSEISSHLDHNEVIELGTRGEAHLLNAPCTFYCEYDKSENILTVSHVFMSIDSPITAPSIGKIFAINEYPTLISKLIEGPVQATITDEEQANSDDGYRFVKDLGVNHALIVPLSEKENLLGIIVLCQHNPEREYLSDEISLARSLAGQVTVALQNATLFHNVQDLEQVKSEMIRMASHDLRNPLTQVSGYLHLMIGTLPNLDERQEKFLERIKRGIDRMESLIEDILNIEKIESQQPINWTPINISALIRHVSASLKPQADLKGQSLKIAVPETNDMVMGSDVQLAQAFNNFINNAIKYTPDGGNVEVRMKFEDEKAHFEVVDSGYGIPLDRQDKIFQRFYRAMSPGTEDIEGTGLGLSLVKTVIEKHGGGVWFTSEEGKGSIFGAWLPIAPITEDIPTN